MNPFIKWVLALVVGIGLAVIALFFIAIVATYVSIWAVGIVILLILLFVAVVAYYAIKEGK